MNTFALILLIATVVTGAAFFYDFFKLRPKRKLNKEAFLKAKPDADKKELKKLMEPTGLLGQIASLFPIILFVFLFRSFFIEPFRIPSGSMMPTLLSGDFIAVTKWSYGIRDPLTNKTLIETGKPERGDVVVFKYPEDTNVDYIKRVVGVPGDEVIYRNKKIYLRKACTADSCDSPVGLEVEEIGTYSEESFGFAENYVLFKEKLGKANHEAMINPRAPEFLQYYYRQPGSTLGSWIVPDGHYFVMGDNRDNSRDSRFWGFVPEEYLIGKTVGIWLSFEFNNGSDDILPSFIPSSIRFSRIGGID
ncbi:signal peptidase I [uncultured Succinatimonas sp.]|uniref:signal peptidase I n=1 Tax=uncultured Succinatimonas sp. TaxID=1262973 RepID=UPI0025DCF4E7|nr:signal peptidase I [uncultured Succinatimonas sp.]